MYLNCNELIFEPYRQQLQEWPKSGRHILAQYDDDSIIVYQAYCPEIANFALKHKVFGGDKFSFSRTSWIKPGFLWMMYRSNWAQRPNQEVVLALRVRRSFFDTLLANTVLTSWDPEQFATKNDWSRAFYASFVRLQWDPDHLPSGGKAGGRRAIQLGLLGKMLEAFGRHELLEVIDMSEFIKQQRLQLATYGINELLIPQERIYRPLDPVIATRIQLAS